MALVPGKGDIFVTLWWISEPVGVVFSNHRRSQIIISTCQSGRTHRPSRRCLADCSFWALYPLWGWSCLWITSLVRNKHVRKSLSPMNHETHKPSKKTPKGLCNNEYDIGIWKWLEWHNVHTPKLQSTVTYYQRSAILCYTQMHPKYVKS